MRLLMHLFSCAVAIIIANDANAQSTILPQGAFVPGHVPVITASGVLADNGRPSGAVAGAQATEFGLTYDPLRTQFKNCLLGLNSGPITAPFNTVCLGFDSGNSPIMTVTVAGVSTAYGFGTGNVTGPNSSTVGHIAFFNSASVVLLKDTNNTATSVVNLTPPTGTAPIIIGGGTASGLNMQTNLSGTLNAANSPNVITNAVAGLNAGANFVSTLYVEQDVTSTSNLGGQDGIDAHVKVTSATSASNTNRNYQPIFTTGEIFVNDGGTGLTINTVKGALFGGGSAAFAHSGATNIVGSVGWESNQGIETGATALISASITLAPVITNAVHGALIDSYIDIGNQSASIALLSGIILNDAHGFPPLDTTNGEIITTDGNAHQIKNGINFGNYTFTGNYIVGLNFGITGVGSFYGSGNISGVFPTTGNNTWVIEDNCSNANSDMCFINRDATHFGGITFYQSTGSGTATFLGGLDTTGFALVSNALATTATKPFIFLPTTAGTPTGVPTGATAGKAACVYDTTGKKFWCYDAIAGAWKGVVLS